MVVKATEEEKILVQGNEAIGWGAVAAGCLHFYGYPVTPQNEVPEWFARELPKRGGRFIQSESETASMNMLWGAGLAGVRAMTSTASVGFSLMQETLSHAAAAQVPCVIVNVQRGGPGGGTAQHSQMDYLQATKGGGNGGYKNIVLAPSSVQETADLIQLAFYLADKWRNPTLVLTDAVVGQTAELLELKTLDFGPLPKKEWAITGKGQKGGEKKIARCTLTGLRARPWLHALEELGKKWEEMGKTELRYETYLEEDAELLLVSFGYTARVCREAVNMARAQGLKAGLLRPITLWPFPYAFIKEKASRGCPFLVVEDNLGQMVEDVRSATEGKTEVHFLGIMARHNVSPGGMILPVRVVEEIKKILLGGEER